MVLGPWAEGFNNVPFVYDRGCRYRPGRSCTIPAQHISESDMEIVVDVSFPRIDELWQVKCNSGMKLKVSGLAPVNNWGKFVQHLFRGKTVCPKWFRGQLFSRNFFGGYIGVILLSSVFLVVEPSKIVFLI